MRAPTDMPSQICALTGAPRGGGSQRIISPLHGERDSLHEKRADHRGDGQKQPEGEQGSRPRSAIRQPIPTIHAD